MRFLIIIVLFNSFFVFGQQGVSSIELENYIAKKEYRKAQEACVKETVNLDEKAFIECGHAFEFDKNNLNEAAKFYDLGLKKYPTSFQIRYEKALLFLNNNKDYEASITLLPLLRSHKNQTMIHNAIGRVEYSRNRTAALMALITSEFLNSNTKFSQQNITSIKELFKRKLFIKTNSSAKKTMSFSSKSKSSKSRSISNNFNHTDFVLSTSSIMGDFNILDEITLLTKEFKTLGKSLDETQEIKRGEYWNYYAPLFINIQSHNLSETAAYYLLRNKKEAYSNWLINHSEEKKELIKLLTTTTK